MGVPADSRRHTDAVVAAALRAADPALALHRHWSPPSGPVRLLAIGKAAAPMAARAATLLKSPARDVLTLCPSDQAAVGIGRVWPCDHPYPTDRNVAAAEAALAFTHAVEPDETLLFLLSGGASAFTALPDAGLMLANLREVTRRLQLSGATITELNTVRKHLERLKGGRLAAACAGRIETLVLSDVLGDPLNVIGSGPAAPDPSTYLDAVSILSRHAITDLPAVSAHLAQGAAGMLPETPKPGASCFARVHHTVIANNRTVVEAVRDQLVSMGFHLGGVQHGVEGDAAEAGRALAARARALAGASPRPVCWVIGGETTVRVGEATGVGGPSQELALAAAIALEDVPRVQIVTLSTDGRDGPTDAAGAVVSGETAAAIRRAGIDPAAALAHHDSHTALGAAGCLLRIPPTGTNLNHVAVALVT